MVYLSKAAEWSKKQDHLSIYHVHGIDVDAELMLHMGRTGCLLREQRLKPLDLLAGT